MPDNLTTHIGSAQLVASEVNEEPDRAYNHGDHLYYTGKTLMLVQLEPDRLTIKWKDESEYAKDVAEEIIGYHTEQIQRSLYEADVKKAETIQVSPHKYFVWVWWNATSDERYEDPQRDLQADYRANSGV